MDTYDKYYRACADIDLDNLEYNIRQLKTRIKNGVKMYAVVKADGYGHGAVMIAKYASKEIDGFAIATIDEGLILRNAGFDKPILILGYTNHARYEELVDYNIMPAIFKEEDAIKLSEVAVNKGKTAKIQIAVDTGMGRIGFLCNKDTLDIIERISKLPGIIIEGVFTHFASSDSFDREYTKYQLKNFNEILNGLKERNINIPLVHASNSAATLDWEEAHFDLVREGIAMYGLEPSDETNMHGINLRQVLSLKSHIVYIKEIEEGTCVSYGMLFKAPKKMRIATIPVGYGDGYFRNLTGKGYVLINGKKAKILGRVCMDQFMVDVTDIPSAKEGNVVTLTGTDNGEFLGITELAKLAGTFNYEFVCDLSKRVPRVYYKDGKIVGEVDYFA